MSCRRSPRRPPTAWRRLFGPEASNIHRRGIDRVRDRPPRLACKIAREPKGGTKKSGEYFRGLAKVVADERDRSANFATKVAGVKERMVRPAERQGAMPAAIVTTALAEVSLTAAADALKASIARQVREVTR